MSRRRSRRLSLSVVPPATRDALGAVLAVERGPLDGAVFEAQANAGGVAVAEHCFGQRGGLFLRGAAAAVEAGLGGEGGDFATGAVEGSGPTGAGLDRGGVSPPTDQTPGDRPPRALLW